MAVENNVKAWIIAIVIGAIIGAGSLWAVLQGSYNRRIDELTATVNELSEGNRELQAKNTELGRINSELTGTVTELRNTIRIDTERYTKEIGRIKETLSGVTGDLSATGAGIQQVIDGIERIKELVKNL